MQSYSAPFEVPDIHIFSHYSNSPSKPTLLCDGGWVSRDFHKLFLLLDDLYRMVQILRLAALVNEGLATPPCCTGK